MCCSWHLTAIQFTIEKGLPISGLETFDGKDDYFVFHAGTKKQGDTFVTNGGRVLGVTATGKDLKEARSESLSGNRVDLI